MLTSPAETLGITVNYNGAKVASITYSATAIGLPDGNVVKEVLTPGAPPTKRQHLYVASAGGNSVSVFDTAHGNAPLAAITGGGLSSATDLAIDASGVLYVANNYGSKRLQRRLRARLRHGTRQRGAAQDYRCRRRPGLPDGRGRRREGKLYVASQVHDSVSVFDTTRGNAALPVITGGLNNSFGVAVDASGKLYVANFGNNTVSVFDTVHGNAVLPAITGDGLNSPFGVAVDASGKLYVASLLHDSVLVFDTAHGNAVLPAITTGLNGPAELALDGSGKLYVANEGNSTVSVFDTAHGNAALPVITVGAFGVAVDASGKL